MLNRSILLLSLVWAPLTSFAQSVTQNLNLGEKIEFHSKVMSEDRRIFVHLPENYNRSDQKYPVLYLLDGEFFFTQAVSAVQYLSELGYIRNQPVPEMIVVGVVNVDRNRDYTPTYAPEQAGLVFPTSGKAETFLKFMNTELFPFVEAKYRTEPYRIISGWSLGGLFTVYTFLEHPEYFSAYLAISPSLWWDKDLYVSRTKNFIKEGEIPKKKIAVTVGSLEGGDIGRSVRDGFVVFMKNEFGLDDFFKTIEIPDESHSYVYYKAIYEGLKLLFSDWQMPNELLGGGIEAMQSFYSKLSEEYGYEITVPEAAYSNLANYVYNQVSTEAAIKIAKLYVNAFPKSSYAQFRLGRFNHLAGNLKIAKACYQKALELENKNANPDSERIVTYTINLKNADKELGIE